MKLGTVDVTTIDSGWVLMQGMSALLKGIFEEKGLFYRLVEEANILPKLKSVKNLVPRAFVAVIFL